MICAISDLYSLPLHYVLINPPSLAHWSYMFSELIGKKSCHFPHLATQL